MRMTATILILRSAKKLHIHQDALARPLTCYLTCLKRVGQKKKKKRSLCWSARSFSRFPARQWKGREPRVSGLTPACVSLRQLDGFKLLSSASVVASERADVPGMDWSFSMRARRMLDHTPRSKLSDSRNKLQCLSRGLWAAFVILESEHFLIILQNIKSVDFILFQRSFISYSKSRWVKYKIENKCDKIHSDTPVRSTWRILTVFHICATFPWFSSSVWREWGVAGWRMSCQRISHRRLFLSWEGLALSLWLCCCGWTCGVTPAGAAAAGPGDGAPRALEWLLSDKGPFHQSLEFTEALERYQQGFTTRYKIYR